MSHNIMNMFVDLMMAKKDIYKNMKRTSAISYDIFSFIQFSIILQHMLPHNSRIKHANKVKFGTHVGSGGGAPGKRGF